MQSYYLIVNLAVAFLRVSQRSVSFVVYHIGFYFKIDHEALRFHEEHEDKD